MPKPHGIAPLLAGLLTLAGLAGAGRAEPIVRAPEPDPPVLEGVPSGPAAPLRAAPSIEWVLHRSLNQASTRTATSRSCSG